MKLTSPPIQYSGIFSPVYKKDNDNYILGVAIRTFLYQNKRYFLFVDPNTVKSSIASIDDIFHRNPTNSTTVSKFSDTAVNSCAVGCSADHYVTWKKIKDFDYVDTLYSVTESPATNLTNGLSHARKETKGYFLTVDMCPSVVPMEQDFFNLLVSLSSKRSTPFPVALCMSAIWIEKHEKELDWLVEQDATNKLDITWVNHSYSHFYLSDLVDTENFLLAPFANLELEMYGAEIALIMRGQTPAPFMRLPGLISSDTICKNMRNVGLIPLNTDAWLAKEEQPTDGSIILVHGNGNEHQGIVDVTKILHSYDPNGWLPIQQAVFK